jgi:hypothetical protein
MTRALVDATYGKLLFVAKPNNTSRTDTTTLTADPDLTITLEANAVYFLEVFLPYFTAITTAQGINVDLAGPSGWLLEAACDIYASAGLSAAGRRFIQSSSRGVGNGNTAAEAQWRLRGTVFTSSGGALTVNWAQFATSANETRVLKGAFILAQKVG